MTHVTCRLTDKNRDQFWNRTLGNRVWATFFSYIAVSHRVASYLPEDSAPVMRRARLTKQKRKQTRKNADIVASNNRLVTRLDATTHALLIGAGVKYYAMFRIPLLFPGLGRFAY